MSRPTILIGFAEALAGPEVAWSLIDAGFQVIAFTRKGRNAALRHSRYVVCHEMCAPESNVEAAFSDLHRLLASVDETAGDAPRVLLPLDDTAVWLCSQMELGAHWVLAGPKGSNAELALDKFCQTEAARQAGFNVPDTAMVRTTRELMDFAEAHSYPIILKQAEVVAIRDGRIYSCPKWICASGEELENAAKQWAETLPLLAQSFVTGTGEGVFGLAAANEVRAWSSHRRLRMMNPQGSGSSACISLAVAEEVKTHAGEMIRHCGWRGLFMIELLRDAQGKVWFVELNGRPWGSMALCRRQGLEYPAWSAQLALNPQADAGKISSTTPGTVCRNAGREFMHLLFVLRGPKSKALKNWPGFWKTVRNVAWVRHKDTFYNWRRKDAKVFFADFYYTIDANLIQKLKRS